MPVAKRHTVALSGPTAQSTGGHHEQPISQTTNVLKTYRTRTHDQAFIPRLERGALDAVPRDGQWFDHRTDLDWKNCRKSCQRRKKSWRTWNTLWKREDKVLINTDILGETSTPASDALEHTKDEVAAVA